MKTDIEKASSAGATIIYVPEASTVYPPGFSTWVDPGALAGIWEGKSRPGHFRGVATVVSILLNTIRPDRGYFGEKDFQQLQIIRRMHRDLRLPGEIVASPTVRDMDGLALSSRNARLSPGARMAARRIPQTLAAMVKAAQTGIRDTAELVGIGHRALSHPDVRLDYLAIVDDETLEPGAGISGNSRILLAVEIDGVRLIDNVALPVGAGQPASWPTP
jgi:pantoate--beta-alanine ligase